MKMRFLDAEVDRIQATGIVEKKVVARTGEGHQKITEDWYLLDR